MTPVNAPAWLVERPIAHRGLHDEAKGIIENTLAAAEAAIKNGFAIECDVQLSSDGEAFVFHDRTLERLTNSSGALSVKTSAEIAKIQIKGSDRPPATFDAFLKVVAGRTPVICELKGRVDGDWRVGDRVAALAASYDGALALKSFDHDLVADLRLRRPRIRPGDLCPIGIVAEASYDDPIWAFLTAEQKREWTDFERLDRIRPDFLSWNVNDLPHKIPFLMKELHGAPIMAWTVRTAEEARSGTEMGGPDRVRGEGRFEAHPPQTGRVSIIYY